MALRDHFRPPLDDFTSWDSFHGGWPMMIVQWLAPRLPPGYFAGPTVHVGRSAEVDIGTFETFESKLGAPPVPSLSLESDLSSLDKYEVRVYDAERGRKLVAAIEIVSPANKDRPEHRQAFAARCAALLQNQVAVSIIDLVTTKQFNLFRELLAMIGQTNSAAVEPPPIYAVSCRIKRKRFEAWEQPLVVGQPLPVLPLWLSEDLALKLELEESYQQTCRVLRLP